MCKIRYNTGAPGAVIILNRNKPKPRKGKILFINASNEYEQHPNVRKLNRLGDEHIEKIVKAYKEFRDSDGFSRVVEIEKIKRIFRSPKQVFYWEMRKLTLF